MAGQTDGCTTSNPHITISKDIHSLKQPELSQPAYNLGLLSAHQRERHLNIVGKGADK